MERRLTAILAADVVGYSRLMGVDEVATLTALKAIRAELIDARINDHLGRIVKLTGDGILVEFPSVVNAVACAAAIQRAMQTRNADVPDNRRIDFRIGIHLGDVIAEDGDIFGDGVNIAARIEGLARPGGVAVSASVRDHVGNKLDLTFEDMGERSLKNIAKPVRVYNLLLDAAPLYISTLASLGPSVPIKLTVGLASNSIAVLPFVNMSGDAEQEYFTDGLTEDIITDLSNVPGFFVIARNSTFVYKGKAADVRQIARDLGVKFVLEGSARRSAQRLRVNVQLIDAVGGGNHIWAERFDRELTDIFEVQDEVTRRIVQAIAGKLNPVASADRNRPSSIEAYDLVLRSRDLFAISKTANDEAIHQLKRALAIDPSYCEALWRLALATTFNWIQWGEPQQPNRANALALAQRSVEIDPRNSGARCVLGEVLSRERRWDEASVEFAESYRLNPNDAEALMLHAEFQIIDGKPAECMKLASRAFRLDPQPPGWFYWILGRGQVAMGRYEDAVATLRRQETYRTPSRRFLIAALARLGRTAETAEEVALFLASVPHWRISKWAENQAFRNDADLQFWIETYRMAGLPD